MQCKKSLDVETDKLMEQLRGEVDGLKENVGEIGENVRDIKLALCGNDFTGGKGIIHDMAAMEATLSAVKAKLDKHDLAGLETRVSSLEKAFDKYKNILVGLSIGAGVGVAKILQMIVDAFTKH